jgi:hypothetical protein
LTSDLDNPREKTDLGLNIRKNDSLIFSFRTDGLVVLRMDLGIKFEAGR